MEGKVDEDVDLVFADAAGEQVGRPAGGFSPAVGMVAEFLSERIRMGAGIAEDLELGAVMPGERG